MGTSNFQIWNPNQTNQENDTAYTSDSLRANGAASGAIFPSPTANKLFYQVSMMVAALGQMMANKGYSVADSNESNLITALSNILTNGDMAGNLIRYAEFTCNIVNNNGYIVFPAHLFANFKIEWGFGSASGPNPTYYHITYHSGFQGIPYVVLPVAAPPTRTAVYVASTAEGAPGDPSIAGCYVGTAGSICAINWIAFGV